MILKLEQQVCSLESAKRLKELGFSQESFFSWRYNAWDWTGLIITGKETSPDGESWSAYTVAELGELLPTKYLGRVIKDDTLKKFSNMTAKEEKDFWMNEAEARAKMLIYLKENNLL